MVEILIDSDFEPPAPRSRQLSFASDQQVRTRHRKKQHHRNKAFLRWLGGRLRGRKMHISEEQISPAFRIYVDVSVIARIDAGTGIQRVVRNIWLALAAEAGNNFELVPVAATPRRSYRAIRPTFLERSIQHLPWPIGRHSISPKAGDVFLGLDLSSHIVPNNVAQFRRWQESGMHLAFVVYDLLPAKNPEWFSARAVDNFNRWLQILLQLSDALLCISHDVADTVRQRVEEEKLPKQQPIQIVTIRIGDAISNGRRTAGIPADAENVLSWMAGGKTVLMVGTIEPRKGHETAISAFRELWSKCHEPPYQLLLVGRPGWHTDRVQRDIRLTESREKWIKWISAASDEYLDLLYKHCDGVLVATRGEGFGLPLLEAACHEKPILARRLPVFREFAPDYVQFFDDDDAASLACRIEDWLATPLPSSLAKNSRSWSEAARDVLTAVDGLRQKGHPAA